ncbi:MAG: alpha/beta hydrolase [Akkermansiaceae bacterium]
MKTVSKHVFTIVRRALGYGFVATFASFVALAIYVLNDRAELSIWHEVDLDEEFTSRSKVENFDGYLELEERLFTQLRTEVYEKTPAGDDKTYDRFREGSAMDPESWETNWNRTFELVQDEAKAGVLLLHGMSDSPYSLRHLGETFHEKGAHVIGLRIPGHGTAPSGLVEVTWKDMVAAVELAAKHLKEQVGEKPIYIVGYSNGGALALMYSIESLDDSNLPVPGGLILLSPEIAVSKAAALAVWQARLGHWFGLEKLAWNSISVEYDPFKYNSFAVNAGDQAHRITSQIDKKLGKLFESGGMEKFPRVLAFQSAVDATVSAPALVSRLFDRLPNNGSELVLFDINRVQEVEQLLKNDPAEYFGELLRDSSRDFNLSVLVNQFDGESPNLEVVVKRRESGSSTVSQTDTKMRWPKGIFSLSHVALPFPEDDPLYGSGNDGETATLGNLSLRGERGTLLLGSGEMLRQKWNPFYSYIEKLSIDFVSF